MPLYSYLITHSIGQASGTVEAVSEHEAEQKVRELYTYSESDDATPIDPEGNFVPHEVYGIQLTRTDNVSLVDVAAQAQALLDQEEASGDISGL